MTEMFYLAWRYLAYHRFKTAILVTSITMIDQREAGSISHRPSPHRPAGPQSTHIRPLAPHAASESPPRHVLPEQQPSQLAALPIQTKLPPW